MKDSNNDVTGRILGHILSREELSTVMSREELEIASGGTMAIASEPSKCTPHNDPAQQQL
ncbi:hypothetical protein [Stenotrophomonas maltophilia]|uniref:hypothetical protein n=1 Tax=Stenotrophomonas maltophilia TaxID=40324 RepID=UPI00066B9E9C|nr:hypothetical protein [Stenotrophomonas maltophilia]HEL5039494.1 hypothetical protein [Stenotrophomonas maltophilia]